MRDIARLAGGVHPSTVSLALRNHPGVGAATRKRIQSLARKLGYQPDPLLAAFNNHRLAVVPHKTEPVIAWITDLPSRTAVDAAPYHRTLLEAARASAASLHCRLDAFFLGDGRLSAERLAGILHARGITAVLVAACDPATPELHLPWDRHAVVRIESPSIAAPSQAVETDRLGAARTAFRQLSGLGYRRIALLTHATFGTRSNDLHLSGYLAEQAASGTKRPAAPLHLVARDPARVVHWVRSQRIDVILVDDPDWSPPRELTRRSSQQRPIAWAALALVEPDPARAGMVPDLQALASHAVHHVVSMLRTHDLGVAPVLTHTWIPATWHAGASAPGCAPAAR